MLFFLLLVCLLVAASAFRMPKAAGVLSMSKLGASTANVKDPTKASGIGWDSHQAIDEIPESLVNTIEGNESMRRKFEAACRNAQVRDP